MQKKLVFTGGHHNSALVVADECIKLGYKIYWFGHRRSMWGDTGDSAEYTEVQKRDISFYDLKAGKLYRTFNPAKLIRIPLGFFQAWQQLRKIRPDCIVSFGGYLAVPTVIAGWLQGVPSLTHEQTVSAGWANKILTKFVNKIAVTWPTSLSQYPKDKTVFTGLPLRGELIEKRITKTKSNRPMLYITGGKLGSHTINTLIFSLKTELEKKYDIVHQTGTSTVHNDMHTAARMNGPHYHSFGYSSEEAMEALHKADVIISRSGAHTVYELGYLGKKCILVPLPNSSRGEQAQNALVLQKAGLAVVIPQQNLEPSALLQAIETALQLNARPMELPIDADKKVIQIIKQLCSREEK